MNIIKRIMQNVFRYRLTACFFIIGQLGVMYVTIFGALGIYNKAYQKEADKACSTVQEPYRDAGCIIE